MKYFQLVILFFIVSLPAMAQDLIIKKDSSKIYCKVVREDSLTISYLDNKDRSKEKLIYKTDVISYYITKTPLTKKVDKTSPEKKIRFHFSLFGGLGYPMGDYKSKDMSNDSAGFAKKGLLIHVSGVLKLGSYFGLHALYLDQRNSFSHETYVTYFNAKYSTNSFSGTSEPWRIKGMFGGFYFTFPIRGVPDLFVDLNTLIGVPEYTLAKFSITANYSPGNSETITQSPTTATAFTYLLNFGLRYKIYKGICFAGGIDLMGAKPYFINVIYTDTQVNGGQNYVQTGAAKFTQQVRQYNIKAGITITMGGIKIKKPEIK